MKRIKYLFWNINNKNLVQELVRIVLEKSIDIVMVVEAENLDSQYFISGLRKKGRYFDKKEVLSRKNGILLLADRNIIVSTYKEEKHFTAYKIYVEHNRYLLVVVHLTSAMYCSEPARDQRANELAKMIEKLEESCNKENEEQGKEDYHTMIVGDFNLHPFSSGIIGAHGFHAVMDLNRALTGGRIIDGNRIRFYYNPMWNLMGRRDHVPGTYYYEADQDDRLFYWYTFDQILLRPELIDAFMWEEFEIIDRIGEISLLRNHRIYSEKYSDHLPVKFAIV